MSNQRIILNGKTFGPRNLEELKQTNEPADSWRNSIYVFLKNWFDESDYMLVNTSGSTGKPKEIRLTKAAMRNSARMTNAFFGLKTTTTALLCLPASYIAGKMMLVRAITAGFNLLCLEPTANPFKDLDQSIDFTAITPYQLTHSLIDIKKSEISKVIIGGAKINAQTEAELQALTTIFYETYGMTETCSHIALRAVNGKNKSDYFSVLNGVSIHKNDANCLCIHAPHLMETDIETNDIVEIQNQNTFKWLGRLDNVINSGGIKISPEIIEQKIENLIHKPFFISSIPDEVLGNKVVLVIESTALNSPNEAKLVDAINSTLEKYERPKVISYLPQFCYSTSNKVLKKETMSLLN
ncbi:MAG: AMP-binding protein [Paludibacter sp.]